MLQNNQLNNSLPIKNQYIVVVMENPNQIIAIIDQQDNMILDILFKNAHDAHSKQEYSTK